MIAEPSACSTAIMRHILRVLILTCGLIALWALNSIQMSGWVTLLVDFLLSTIALTGMHMVDSHYKRE
jgi:fatty acid desaturase